MLATIFPATVLGIYPLQNSVLVSHNNYSFELKNDQLSLFQNHSKKVQYWDYADNTLCMQNVVTKEYFLINNKGTNPLKSLEAERILKRNIEEFGGYRVSVELRGLFEPKVYRFEHIQTGKQSELTIEGTLITIIDNSFYFNILMDNKIVKLNANFELLETKIFDKNSKGKDYIDGLIFTYIPKESPRIEVFDLVSFETLQILPLPPCKGSRMIADLTKTKDLILFSCGDTSYGWDGKELQTFFEGKEVSCIEEKGDFVYISFINDPALYAYSPDLKTLLHKERALVNGYYLYSMASQGDKNFAHFWKCFYHKKGGLEYFVSWRDDEFFSEMPCIADLESPIFKEVQLPVDDNFSLQLKIIVGEDYGTVARQTLAALGEALEEHSFYQHRFDAGQPVHHSERFTGAIELLFENSKQLDAEQKSQLQFAGKNVLASYGNHIGAATGELCSISFVFA
ncbi:MAG: hypothetical protein ACJAS1_005094 [Oleiphilaceae bacterium]|jgi:hypothetical protein